MTNESIVVFGAVKALETAGATIANNAIVAASAANYSLAIDGASFPDAEFAAAFSFATAPAEGGILALYARPLDVDGTASGEVPEATRPTIFIGSFIVNNVTTTQYVILVARDLPRVATYYLHNSGTGQSVAGGWTLKVMPRTYKSAA